MSSQFESGKNRESREFTVREQLGIQLLDSFKVVQSKLGPNSPLSDEHIKQLETLRRDIFVIKRAVLSLEITSLSQIAALQANIQSLHDDIVSSIDSIETLQSLSERIHTLQTSLQKSKNTEENN